MSARLVFLSPGQAFVDIDGEVFNVNGEGKGDGTWEVFPLMVYERAPDSRWVLIQDAGKRERIIAALKTCWPDNHPGGWTRLEIADHEPFDRPLILPVDIVQRVVSDFTDPDEAAAVRGLLESLEIPEAERVARCILHLSAGSASAVLDNIALAKRDYRDAILFAEYDRNDNRLHDFSKPFRLNET
ncbi:MAG: hypothetical protein QNJ19_14025 [Woeseiaceae bacterium]|nr:hypothetical protein [Woeseiaceae bacterium]